MACPEFHVFYCKYNSNHFSFPIESSSVPKLSSPDMYLNLRFSSEVKERILPSTLSDVPDLVSGAYGLITKVPFVFS